MKNILFTNNQKEFDFFLKKKIHFSLVTSSYSVYRASKKLNFESFMQDEFISDNNFNQISKKSFHYERAFRENMIKAKENYSIDFIEAMKKPLLGLINTSFYFASILDQLMKKYNGQLKLYYFVNKNIENESPLDPSYKRYENVISLILDNTKNIQKVPLKISIEEITVDRSNSITTPLKIIFKLFYNTKSSFLFKVWRSKYFYTLIKNILIFFNYKKIFIYDCFESNELMQDIFLDLLKNKIVLVKLDKFNYKFKIPIFSNKFQKNIYKLAMETEKKINFQINYEILNSVVFLISKKINVTFEYFEQNKDYLDNYFIEKFKFIYSGDKVYSRGFFRVQEILMFHFMKNKGIENIVFEHGITHGFAKITKYLNNYYELQYSDKSVFLCPISTKYLLKKNKINRYYSGVPEIFSKNFIERYFNKKIFKYLLGLNKNKIVIFAPFPEINNYVMGPYYPRDINIEENIKILGYLCKKHNDKNVILKLYPTFRHQNEYDYKEELNKYKNLKIIKFIDLRYLMPVVDIIYTTLNTSTIGIIYKSKKKGFFLNYSWNKISIEGDTENINLSNLKSVHEISSFKELDYSWNTNFIKKII